LTKGGRWSGSGGAIDKNDAVTMATVLGSTRSLATLLDYRLEVPVAALVKAAAVGNEAMMAMLLSREKNSSDRQRNGGIREALVTAAMCWHVEAVQVLLDGISGPSHKSAGENSDAVQKALYKALEDNLCTEFCRDGYVRQRQFLVVKELVKAGGDLAEFSIWDAVGVLHSSGHVDIGRELGIFMIEKGVDFSAVSSHGRSALPAAAGDREDDASLVAALLAAGQPVSSTDEEGNTAIYSVRQLIIVKLLRDNGAEVSSRNNSGWTPLISVACLNENTPQLRPQTRIEVCRLLLYHGVDINACATDDLTALHRAVSAKDTAVVKFLLKNGADTSLATQTGESALHRACRMTAADERSWVCRKAERLSAESLEVVRLLLEYGAFVGARDNKGRTPIFYILKGYRRGDYPKSSWFTRGSSRDSSNISTGPELYSVAVEACDLMLSHGADVHAKDGEGLVFRNLIQKKGLLKPIAGLIPERVEPLERSLSSRGGRGSRGGRARG
jgi:hypothetical protein